MPVVAPAGEALFPTAEKVPKKAALALFALAGSRALLWGDDDYESKKIIKINIKRKRKTIT